MSKIKKGDRIYWVSSYFMEDGKPSEVCYCEIASIGKVKAVVNYISPEDGEVLRRGDAVYSENRDGDFMFFRTEAEAWAHRVEG